MNGISALADALPDFSGIASSRLRPSPASSARAPEPVSPTPSDMADPDDAMRLAREIARAEAALAEALDKRHSEALEREREAASAALTEMQRRFGEEFGATIAARLDQFEKDLAESISAAAARVLAPVLTEDLRRRMVDALAAEISAALEDADGLRLRVAGPQALHEAVALALGPLADRLDFTEAEAPDLTITFNDRIIETRLGEWGRSLSELMA